MRVNHHNRISEQITANDWLPELTSQNITRQNLIELCKSHCESLKTINPPEDVDFDLRFCAVLLRLADILDFDSTRAPDALFKHLGLNTPEDYEHSISQLEWLKNRSGGFGKINLNKGTIHFSGSFSCIALEVQVKEYEKWVTDELISCAASLSKYNGKWSDFRLPYKISENIDRQGYKFGDFRLTMDDDHVINLLIGQNLYSDPDVFVRELLQNSIDAILARRELDSQFKPDDGKIIIRTWRDNDGYDWFRIEDNGTGMDEHVILEYFLKIGSSYYTSDDFQVDRKRYNISKQNTFNPISRFGIGILSCFISDPKNNRIEVSTKRYSHSPDISNSAIRLNIDGLHGYYYYADEAEQNDFDIGFQPLHSPDNTIATGYRSEVGTTLCVRTNLFKMQNIRSFKDIVDKYVQFPDVQIEYFGQDGHKIYPCRKDFEEKIDNIGNYDPDKKCVLIKHDLPDNAIAEVSSNMPGIKWINKPSINLSYYSLSKLSIDDGLSGIALYVNAEATVEITESIIFEGVEYKPEFECRASYDHVRNQIQITFIKAYSYNLGHKLKDQQYKSILPGRLMSDVDLYYDSLANDNNNMWEYLCELHNISRDQLAEIFEKMKSTRETKRLYDAGKKEYTIYIPMSEMLNAFSDNEAFLWNAVLSMPNYNNYIYEKITMTSYNGIFVDKTNFLNLYTKEAIGLILLLHGEDYYPDMNIARNQIKTFPYKALLNMSYICQHFPTRLWRSASRFNDLIKSGNYQYITEKEYHNFLKENPIWEKTIDELTKETSFIYTRSPMLLLLYNLSLAVLKMRFDVYCYIDSWGNTVNFKLERKESEAQPLDFPVQLFFHFSEHKHLFAMDRFYNVEHPFSQWLIKNQSTLREKAPGLYYNLLDKMLNDSSNEIKDYIITMLSRIKELNICGIEDNLYDNLSFIIT